MIDRGINSGDPGCGVCDRMVLPDMSDQVFIDFERGIQTIKSIGIVRVEGQAVMITGEIHHAEQGQ